MLAIAATGFGTPSVGARVLNALFGQAIRGFATRRRAPAATE